MKYLPLLFIISLGIGCSLPKERYSQFQLQKDIYQVGDSTIIALKNTVPCPIRITFEYSGASSIVENFVLQAYEQRIFKYTKDRLSLADANKMAMSAILTDPAGINIDTATRYLFPFPKDKTYKIIQGYNGSFSHNDDYSRYAIDFSLQVGDTVCASRDGVVVGVIEGYRVGGRHKKYRPFANYITLYHNDGTLTQYVHLQHNGAFVAIGDTVTALQPIGLSGKTGFTSTPHLHFNVLKPTAYGVAGFRVHFEKIDGNELKRGMIVNH